MVGTGIITALLASIGIPAWISVSKPDRSEISTEFLHWTKSDRQIDTSSINALIGRDLLSGHLRIYGGATATYAWGKITQLEGDYSLGTLHETTYGNRSFGIGPVFQFRLIPIPSEIFTFGIDVGGGILFYSEPFPAGGRHYNGMFRVGPAFEIKKSEKVSILLKGQWMHVSNGQGLAPYNPSYEGVGLVLGVNRKL